VKLIHYCEVKPNSHTTAWSHTRLPAQRRGATWGSTTSGTSRRRLAA